MNLGPQQVLSAGGAVSFVPSVGGARFGFDSIAPAPPPPPASLPLFRAPARERADRILVRFLDRVSGVEGASTLRTLRTADPIPRRLPRHVGQFRLLFVFKIFPGSNLALNPFCGCS